MVLSSPKKIVFWIATIIALLGLLGYFVTIPWVSDNTFAVMLIAFITLWLGVYFKDF